LHARRSALPSGEGFSPCEIFFENFARRVKKNILKKIFFQKIFPPVLFMFQGLKPSPAAAKGSAAFQRKKQKI